MMQEIKTEDPTFPYDDFSALDYESHVFGQKSYNGVAIISKHKLENIRIDLIKDKLKQSRIISAEVKFKRLFPEYASRTDLLYQQPSWKVRIGDYYREIDAQKMLKEIRMYFPDAFIVRDYIRRPFIDIE